MFCSCKISTDKHVVLDYPVESQSVGYNYKYINKTKLTSVCLWCISYCYTRSSAIAEGLRDALVSRNLASHLKKIAIDK